MALRRCGLAPIWTACFCVSICAIITLFLIYAISVTRSLVITGLTWISVFSFFAASSAIISFLCKSHHSRNKKFTYGYVRAPVLAVFSTTVLAQLSAVFLTKEAVERFFDGGQHHHSHHGGEAAIIQEGDIEKSGYLFYPSILASAISLLTVAYALNDQPFSYVLKHAHSSIIQEHASDISSALCYFVPGLARLLLPRINSLSLLSLISSVCAIFVHWFRSEFYWVDSAAALTLSIVVFSSLMPLLISEASTVDGVLELINAHFWQLDFSTIAGSVDVRVRRDADEQAVLKTIHNKLSSVVNNCTVQILKDPTSTWASQKQHLHNPPTPIHNHHESGSHSHSHDHSNNHSHGHSHNHSQEHHHH
uniref:Cation efflux protein transmembrane domain-containing protein n=1 Tax=Meloidogyne incognita TaxID=6306 RepID=A0A914LQX9_MELIC